MAALKCASFPSRRAPPPLSPLTSTGVTAIGATGTHEPTRAPGAPSHQRQHELGKTKTKTGSATAKAARHRLTPTIVPKAGRNALGRCPQRRAMSAIVARRLRRRELGRWHLPTSGTTARMRALGTGRRRPHAPAAVAGASRRAATHLDTSQQLSCNNERVPYNYSVSVPLQHFNLKNSQSIGPMRGAKLHLIDGVAHFKRQCLGSHAVVVGGDTSRRLATTHHDIGAVLPAGCLARSPLRSAAPHPGVVPSPRLDFLAASCHAPSPSRIPVAWQAFAGRGRAASRFAAAVARRRAPLWAGGVAAFGREAVSRSSAALPLSPPWLPPARQAVLPSLWHCC